MITITSAVKQIVERHTHIMQAMHDGILNNSEYARLIKEDVESDTKKSVRLGSIIAALRRIQIEVKDRPSLKPSFVIERLSIQHGLSEIAFDSSSKLDDIIVNVFTDQSLRSSKFFTVTQGVSEVSIIMESSSKDYLLATYRSIEPKLVKDDLVALTVSHSEDYINTPNVYWAMVGRFAARRVNVVEFLSTFTESTFLFEKADYKRALDALQDKSI